MKKETHETSCNNGVANPNVPSSPLLFEPVERRKVGALVELLCGVEASSRGVEEIHGEILPWETVGDNTKFLGWSK